MITDSAMQFKQAAIVGTVVALPVVILIVAGWLIAASLLSTFGAMAIAEGTSRILRDRTLPSRVRMTAAVGTGFVVLLSLIPAMLMADRKLAGLE